MTQHKTTRAQQDGRIDTIVSNAFEIGRRQAARIVKAGGVLVDGKRIRVPSEKVKAGQLLEMNPEARLSEQPVQIMYENKDVWVVAKPAGLPTEPGRDGGDCLTARLAHMLSMRTAPAASHRLDLRASGLVAIAKEGSSLRQLNDAFRHRLVSRGYLALVRTWRPVSAQTIEEPLATSRGHVRVDPAGAPALTTVKPLGFDAENGVALVALRLQSGRQHQARVHLASAIGAIVGDRRYGDLLSEAPRIALHAGWISWDDSIGLSPVTVHSEPDADFWSLCPRTLSIPDNWVTELGLIRGAKSPGS